VPGSKTGIPVRACMELKQPPGTKERAQIQIACRTK
jgi:hypothetical protein